MTSFPLPSNLVASAARDRHDRRRRWLQTLPDVVAALGQRWSLQLGGPFQPGGETAWVAPARDADGSDLVLKVGWTHPEAAHEAAGLHTWAGRGTVLLLAHHRDGDTTALLLERCRPGSELGQTRPPEEQDEVVAALLRRLWVDPGADHPFRPLQQMCDEWAAEYDADPNPRLDPGIAREGLALFRSLPSSASREALLLTDLHGGNVLAAQREPWLVIDPKPYVGDPAYDPLQHMLNHDDRLHRDPVMLARRMADLCGLDGDRVLRWLFARCVVESSSNDDLVDVAARIATA